MLWAALPTSTLSGRPLLSLWGYGTTARLIKPHMLFVPRGLETLLPAQRAQAACSHPALGLLGQGWCGGADFWSGRWWAMPPLPSLGTFQLPTETLAFT